MAKKLYDKDTMELDAIEMEGRTVKLGVEDIYEQLKEVTDTMRAALIAGEEPLNIVVGALEDLDYVKLACTVPRCFIRKNILARINGDIADALGDDEYAVISSEAIADAAYGWDDGADDEDDEEDEQ